MLRRPLCDGDARFVAGWLCATVWRALFNPSSAHPISAVVCQF
jgi:hypothetical protein